MGNDPGWMKRDTALKFTLGSIVATPGALEALAEAHLTSLSLLSRHSRGDWGDISSEDRGLNEEALLIGERLLSVYPLPTGETIWIITERDRSVTTLLLPEDY